MVKKKKINKLLIFLVLGIILIFGGITSYNFIQQEAFPGSGCNLEYNYNVDANSYICPEDECIVSGIMTVAGSEQTAAIYNFCPSSELDFLYCTGVDSNVIGLGTYETATFKLFKNEWVNFTPEYADEQVIVERTIMVKGYECNISIEEDIVLSSDESYAIGREIKNVEVQLFPNYGTITNVPIDLILIDIATQQQVGSKVSAVTGSNGKVTVDCATPGSLNCFNYIPDEEQTLLIKAVVDPFGLSILKSKEVEILTGLDLILSCPIQGIVNRNVLCQWILKDATTGTEVSGTPFIEIFQGGQPIDFKPIGTTQVEFAASIVGSADVYITLSKPNYVDDSDYAQVSIQDTEIEQFLYIDNKNFRSLNTITGGQHTIKFRAEESGEDAMIKDIIASIVTPSGEVVQLDFNKFADGWRVLYNFQQTGHTYYLSGSVTFEDESKENMPIAYSIVTSAGLVDTASSKLNYIISGISVGAVAFIALIIYLLRRKTKRSKK